MKCKLLSFFLTFLMVVVLLQTTAFALPDDVPSKLEAPKLLSVELKTEESGDHKGQPYFEFQVQIPQSIIDLDKAQPTDGFVLIDYFANIDNQGFEKADGGHLETLTDTEYIVPGKTNTYYFYYYPDDEGTMEEVLIKDRQHAFKAQFFYQYYYGEPNEDGEYAWDYIESPFSNEVSIGSGDFYSKANEWAKPELQKAADLGLIPGILNGADMTKPINREEFCELSVLLYEKVAAETSQPVSVNPFTDTTNTQILKAYKLGITSGTSATTFSPKVLINREQCAAMLFRAIKAIKPDEDYSIEGVKDFPDQNNISTWAVEATKYMSKVGIITGDAQGNFMPKAITTAQEAASYGMATREQAIALSVRTYEKLN
ncbi:MULTISPECIES: S-layer homology domain-containing protein [unclassified Sedimentibacter]|uniref:S-layer homology domain-containing protein n=1 Tax=unclassified Sedimentibacter TaxID=2649220 RepID=UPI0027E0822B|nr:S-layer homology domain-containing protein [Sedimentibacter sp. MB35-C1]WMJ78683.1 S-layer homology domain-containing protein [Sedimentibacter sp. MB35-C1]